MIAGKRKKRVEVKKKGRVRSSSFSGEYE